MTPSFPSPNDRVPHTPPHPLHITIPMHETSVVLTIDPIRPSFTIRGMGQLAIQGFFNPTNIDMPEIGRLFEEPVQLPFFPGTSGVRNLTRLRPSLEFLGLLINLARATPLAAGAETSRLKTLSLGINSTLEQSENATLFTSVKWDQLPGALQVFSGALRCSPRSESSGSGLEPVFFLLMTTRESWPALEELKINVGLGMGRDAKIIMRFYKLAGMVSNMV